MKPSDLFVALADIVTETVKRPYREESVTPAELDIIADRIIQFFHAQREEQK